MKISAPKRLTYLDGHFTSAVFSPDSERIAFAYTTQTDYAICTMDRDGGGLTEAVRHRTARGESYSDLQFSPDGGFLICNVIDERDEVHDIVQIELATGEQKRLNPMPNALNPHLSPEGQKIVFAAHEGNGVSDLWRLDKIGSADWSPPIRLTHTSYVGKQQRMDSPPRNLHPLWNPDSDRIAFISSALTDAANQPFYICLIRPDGSDFVRLNNAPPIDRGRVFWHPDGRRLAFSLSSDLEPDPNRKLWQYRRNLYMVDADGKNLKRLEVGDSVSQFGSFHPGDGRYIAHASSCGHRFQEALRNWDIRLLDVETGEVFAVTDNDVYDTKPVFSPDGNTLLFVSEGPAKGGMDRCDLYVVDIRD